MSVSMYDASIPVFIRFFNNLSAILDKAAAHAGEIGLDPAELTGARLAPDMFPLTRQVQIASDAAKGCAARLAGIEIPAFPDSETTIADLQLRIAKTVAFLNGITPAQLAGSETRTVTLTLAKQPVDFTGRDYLFDFALPNFFFHVTTTYGLLRQKGVAIGKMDFLGKFLPR